MRSYFTSPIGYVVAAVLFALYGFYYYSVMLSGSTYYISTFVYSNMFIWSMMLLPILTMRVFSEEQKNRTDQALLTAPVGLAPSSWANSSPLPRSMPSSWWEASSPPLSLGSFHRPIGC